MFSVQSPLFQRPAAENAKVCVYVSLNSIVNALRGERRTWAANQNLFDLGLRLTSASHFQVLEE